MKITIFYSWQSDTLSKTNRRFIEQATKNAIQRIILDDTIELEPVLDRDTLNIPGSPAVAQSILEKIDRCGILLSDVTLVTPPDASRPSPNPNVLLELGYAAARIGWERVICVMNEANGEASKLPFDLQHRRWPIRYTLKPGATKATTASVKTNLSNSIEYAIRTVIQSGILATTINSKDRRVAIKLQAALTRPIGTFAVFLRAHDYEEAMNIINETYPDEAGSEFPPKEVIKPILDILTQNSLKGPSHMRAGERQFSWIEVLIEDLVATAEDCNQILDQYADRDDQLISVVDSISTRAETLASILATCISNPELTTLYDSGVPEVHMDFFRYFLLEALKAYRIIREFKPL